MATNGRGHVLEAVFVWSWETCSAMQYLAQQVGRFDWIAVVPVRMYGSRPPWVPAHARAVQLDATDVAYCWADDPGT